ncbi:Agamous-like MADS-box protein AGL29 [Linum perenne]
MGRRKIQMTMVKDKNCRQVTFSKRRTGLFKKAHELATLCAVQIAVLVFSPGGKPFSFGSPDVNSITDQFLNLNEKPSTSGKNNNISSAMKEMNEELDSLHSQVEAEKEKEKTLKEQVMALGGSSMKPINKMRLDELREMKERLVTLEGKLDEQAMVMDASSSLLLLSGTQSMEMDAPSTLLLLSRTQAMEEAINLDDSNIS